MAWYLCSELQPERGEQEQQGFALPLLTVHAHTIMAHDGSLFLKEACLRVFLNPPPLVCTYFSRFDHIPGGTSDKGSTCQCRRHKRCECDPWVRKLPWRRAQQPTQCSCLEQLSTYAHVCKQLKVFTDKLAACLYSPPCFSYNFFTCAHHSAPSLLSLVCGPGGSWKWGCSNNEGRKE